MKGDKIQPKVFQAGEYSISVGEKEIGKFSTKMLENSENVKVDL